MKKPPQRSGNMDPMPDNVASLAQKLLNGDVRALARVISLIEDEADSLPQLIEQLFPHTGKAYVIGVTGAPGAGKSTLVDQLVASLLIENMKVAVLAVDPSSPFTGGALLGDRIRMSQASERGDVYIRSMASRGALGGMAPRTSEAIFALDAAGFDVVVVETVGVGQSEVEIVRSADTIVVVMVPGMGDAVQTLKAGILEIADMFAINKADYSGADRLEKDLRTMLSLHELPAWKPPILRTVATEGKGVNELLTEILKHKVWAESSGEISKRRESFLQKNFESRLGELASKSILEFAKQSGSFRAALTALTERKQDPWSLAEKIVKDYSSGRLQR